MKNLRIAAIQLCSIENKEENLATCKDLMEQAVRDGAKLIALPENFSFIGKEGEKLAKIEDLENGPSVQFLSEFSLQHEVGIIGGSVPLKASDNTKVTNTCLVFDTTGKLTARYDKIHLFDINLDKVTSFTESRYVQPGEAIVTIEMFGVIMGLSICYDLRFPELYRSLTFLGAKVLFVPAAFTVPTGKDHWEILLRSRAIENQCFVVAPAQVGNHNEERTSYGHTMIIDPWGYIMAQCPDQPGIIVCDLDFERQKTIRRKLPCLTHIRPEVYSRMKT